MMIFTPDEVRPSDQTLQAIKRFAHTYRVAKKEQTIEYWN